MLQGLFGNKSIEKILYFLLVNEKAYATQMHRLLQTPLTPLQKGLEKLEREGILVSLFEGKTKFYAFNPHYPLQAELGILLKKAYAHLPPAEKNIYHMTRKGGKKIVWGLVWEQLLQTKQIAFTFRSLAGNQGQGRGHVRQEIDSEGRLLFHESGSWRGTNGQEFLFRNAFRWTLANGKLTLEHLRLGINRPVFLFHLIPTASHTLTSAQAHICGQDTYFGRLTCKDDLVLSWRIIGPKKNEEMTYTYSV